MTNKLHIISFDVPYPTNYGGVIDVFYKLKALHHLGVIIYLHVFEYGKGEQVELKKYCKEVFYYPRNSFVKSFFSKTPFIVKSRGSNLLIANLNKNDYPILFEGLHTTLPVIKDSLKNRNIYLRAHNIEHRFYKGLEKSESNAFKRTFFRRESKKLRRYEEILKKMQGVFSISPIEQAYFKNKYGDKCVYIPAFHDTEKHTSIQPRGNFILYHGHLLVSENVKAALFLIDVYKETDYQLVIASNYKNTEVITEVLKHENITFNPLTDENDLNILFENAHINALPTFQNTGIKLKLLNTLRQGKFIIANDYMVNETGLETLCEKANTKTEFLSKTAKLFNKDFEVSFIEERKILLESFDSKSSAKKIIDLIFKK